MFKVNREPTLVDFSYLSCSRKVFTWCALAYNTMSNSIMKWQQPYHHHHLQNQDNHSISMWSTFILYLVTHMHDTIGVVQYWCHCFVAHNWNKIFFGTHGEEVCKSDSKIEFISKVTLSLGLLSPPPPLSMVSPKYAKIH